MPKMSGIQGQPLNLDILRPHRGQIFYFIAGISGRVRHIISAHQKSRKSAFQAFLQTIFFPSEILPFPRVGKITSANSKPWKNPVFHSKKSRLIFISLNQNEEITMAIRLSNNFTAEVLEKTFAPDPQAFIYFILHSPRRTAARLCPLQLLFYVTHFLEDFLHGISIQKAD